MGPGLVTGPASPPRLVDSTNPPPQHRRAEAPIGPVSRFGRAPSAWRSAAPDAAPESLPFLLVQGPAPRAGDTIYVTVTSGWVIPAEVG